MTRLSTPFLLSFLLCFATLSGAVGCSTSRTVTTESSRSHDYDSTGGSAERTVTTTEVEESDSGCGGVLSCTVNVLGEIIALPFRAVGALASAIF